MYTYAVDGPTGMRDKPAAEPSKDAACPGPERSKFTVLSFSLSNCWITWCFGPGISAVFITKNASTCNLRVLSCRFPA